MEMQMKAFDLIDVRSIHPGISFDIRYATSQNFTGQTLYPFPFCLVHPQTAKALNQVQTQLEAKGIGLKIFDGYRPLSVQHIMWDIVQDEQFVANPAKRRSRHARGTAVDATLVDRQGNELEMPTPFDDFTELAHSHCQALPPSVLANRKILQQEMCKAGFELFDFEWWHFDLKGWQNNALFPALDLSLDDLRPYSLTE